MIRIHEQLYVKIPENESIGLMSEFFFIIIILLELFCGNYLLLVTIVTMLFFLELRSFYGNYTCQSC